MSNDPASVRVVRDRAKVAALGARPLPPGYALTRTRGNAWASYGWIHEDHRGRLMAAALGFSSAEKAAEAAWEHDNEQLRKLQGPRSGVSVRSPDDRGDSR